MCVCEHIYVRRYWLLYCLIFEIRSSYKNNKEVSLIERNDHKKIMNNDNQLEAPSESELSDPLEN